MTKIICAADLHYGKTIMEARAPGEARTLGPQGFLLARRLIHYANTHDVDAIIHLGDETTRHLKTGIHLKYANDIASLLETFNGVSIRLIGNHEPHYALDDLGLNTESHIVTTGSFAIAAFQPVITPNALTMAGWKTIYSYNSPENRDLLSSEKFQQARHKLIASHWGLDRHLRGKGGIRYKPGYAHEHNPDIYNQAESMSSPVIAVHGHEHMHTMTYGENDTMCIGLPSISQAHLALPKVPCGIFMELSDEGPDGALTLAYKRIHLPTGKISPIKPETVATYTPRHMNFTK